MVIICIAISLICCCVDLAIKEWVENKTIQTQEFKKVPLKIRRVHNSGFLMNTLDDKPRMVQKVSFVVAMFFGFYQMFLLSSKRCAAAKISGAFMLGGAISNLYDRVIRGYVVDYVSIKTKWKKVGNIVFNLADVCIFLGSIGLLLFGKKERKK